MVYLYGAGFRGLLGSCHNKETILLTIDPYYGNLIKIPEQEPSSGIKARRPSQLWSS